MVTKKSVLPAIHAELLKLGIEASQSTVAKYIRRCRRPPFQTWRTFLANRIGQIVAADFFVVPTATDRLLFGLVILAHPRRRPVRVACLRKTERRERQDAAMLHGGVDRGIQQRIRQ